MLTVTDAAALSAVTPHTGIDVSAGQPSSMSNIDKNGATTQLRQPGIVITDDKIPVERMKIWLLFQPIRILPRYWGFCRYGRTSPPYWLCRPRVCDAPEPPQPPDARRGRSAGARCHEGLYRRTLLRPRPSARQDVQADPRGDSSAGARPWAGQVGRQGTQRARV